MCCAAVPLFSERSEIVKGTKEAPPPKEGEDAEEKGSDEKQVPAMPAQHMSAQHKHVGLS
jgi:hypothetical protein